MTKAEQASKYIADRQKEIGLALLLVMRQTRSDSCEHWIEMVNENGDKYEVITTIEKIG
jgi:diaminopimelate epimerase